MIRRAATVAAALLAPALLLAGGCAGDPREDPIATEAIWDDAPEQLDVAEPIAFAERTDIVRYGLPRGGNAGIGALIDILPAEGQAAGDPDLWIAPGAEIPTDQCRGGAPNVVDALPITFEAVVTLHPRQYLKLPVCGQDERNYGTFTVEDDSGGIVFVRDSRVAPFTFGDRVRITVNALTLTFGRDPDTRAILAADIEALPPLLDVDTGEPERTVLFAYQDGPFVAADVGHVRRVIGWVLTRPTNQNFNAMVLADRRPPPPAHAGEGDRVCKELCSGGCRSRCGADALADCEATFCDPLCVGAGNTFDEDGLPEVLADQRDAELGRRGFSPEAGLHVSVTGPVVNSFGRTIWVIRKGQIEVLE